VLVDRSLEDGVEHHIQLLADILGKEPAAVARQRDSANRCNPT